MRKVISAITVICILMIGSISFFSLWEPIQAQEEAIPSYAKWGRMAMKETSKKYPNAQIIDYLHVGKKTKGDNAVEQFKLWLKESNREFGVLIDIEFHPDTDEVISVNFKEVNQ
ncbi:MULTISPECIES: YqzG/YhdC family protein [Bacillaceae]|uniref:DUF3889 domain-containing protein n=1 Tax=Oceanobacillus caeni TaxID=405946 RepID=A0ABR5MGT5_9BACI|nr:MULTISPECIES: YqzG/YhdC family protein [Bacillaceae]KPH72129.1 hypothetical protein AFL42_14005 [Oceanobacillus caeni]MED4473295.1 YqzG/YhdC family protein [Oceanobacillus caeni]